jgi:hypothetical protein
MANGGKGGALGNYGSLRIIGRAQPHVTKKAWLLNFEK